MKNLKRLFFLIVTYLSGWLVQAQDMLVPTRQSQKATIMQRIGTTDVTIDYHSPLAKGRTIFGGIIPYDFIIDGEEFPWRAGSNENTTIEFSQDVIMVGQVVTKGKYGLHVLVSEKEWTFILSRISDSWGSFYYNPQEDVIRVTSPVEKTEYQDWLSYDFVKRQPASVSVELTWTDVKAQFEVSIDVNRNVYKFLSEKEDKSAMDYFHLAKLTLALDPDQYEEAMGLIDQSISKEETFYNRYYKSRLLTETGKQKAGNELAKEALAEAKDFDWYYYALGLLFLEGKEKDAFNILNDQLKVEPKSYPVHLAMGEYYLRMGDQVKATKHFKSAYEYAKNRSKGYARYMYLSNQLILENTKGE